MTTSVMHVKQQNQQYEAVQELINTTFTFHTEIFEIGERDVEPVELVV